MVLLEYFLEVVVEDHKTAPATKLRVVLEAVVLEELIIATPAIWVQPMELIKQVVVVVAGHFGSGIDGDGDCDSDEALP